MDEREGRLAATALGLQPVGVLGILLRAKHSGRLALVEPAMQALRCEAQFRIRDSLYQAVLQEAGEGP
jgi:predicted nucleic acid-binding protein